MIRYLILLFLAANFYSPLHGQEIETIELTSGATLGVEGCPDTLAVELSFRPLNTEVIYFVLTSGSATADDFTTELPDTLVFPSGVKRLTFPIEFIEDGIDEGVETLNFQFIPDGQGDPVEFSIEIHDDIPLEIQFPEDTTICLKNYTTFTATGAAEYYWYARSENSLDSYTVDFGPEIQYFPLFEGDTLFVEGRINNCVKDTFIVPDLYPDNLTLSEQDTLFICLGEPENLNFTATNGTANWTYEPTDSIDIEEVNPGRLEVDAQRNGHIYFEMVGENCTIYDTIFIRVDSLPEEYVLDNVPAPREECNKYCRGDTLSIISNTTRPTLYPDATFSWQPNDGSILFGDTSQNILVEALDSNYYVRTTTNNACQTEDSIFIEVINPSMELSLSDTTVCANKPVMVELLNAENYTEISWSPEEGISCTDCPNPTITVDRTTTFMVEGKEEDCCPTSASITVNVEIPPIPIPEVFTCPGEPVQINVDGAQLSDPNWVGNNTESLSCDDCFNPEATVTSDQQFVLEAFDDEGCLNRGIANVSVFPPLDLIDIMIEPSNEIGIGGTAGVTVSTQPELPEGTEVSYILNDMLLEDLSGFEVDIPINQEGEQVLEVLILDQNGCINSETTLITGVPPEVDIPNAFTPNGDDINDVFRPVITNADNITGLIEEFRIYARWGQKVYEETGPDIQGWDGTFNGDPAPPEVYLYSIKIQFPDGETELRKGDVTLIR